MKQDIDYIKFIDRYLQGEMNPEEKVWFEKEIEGNLPLKNEVDLRRKVDSVLADKELIELKMQLNNIHQEIAEITENGRGAIRKVYQRVYLTAGVLAVFVLAFTLFLSNRNFPNEKLVDMYYQPAQASVNFRSVEQAESQLSLAMNLYNNKEFEKAIQLFEEVLQKDNELIGANLYSGISHMEVKEYNSANQRFQRIIDAQPNPFVESARWYLGVCYIMTNERSKAAEQFEILADFEGYYNGDAKKILKRIK